VSHEAEEDARSRAARARDALVRLDGQPLLLGAAERLRRRLPGDDRFGDPLSTAGDDPAHVVGRQVRARTPQRASVLKELGLGALQSWQAISESTGRGRGEREVSLLFTDLVGFSSWALDAGDEAALVLLREVGSAVEGRIAFQGGHVVKRLGDGLMATFTDPGRATQAALEAQALVDVLEVAGHRPRLRAGVHLGRPRKLGGDYLGVDVNVAARVADAAGGGEVLVSDAVAERLDPGTFDTGRRRRLRAAGAPRELRVCAVRLADR
jgi:adenylate cyclase